MIIIKPTEDGAAVYFSYKDMEECNAAIVLDPTGLRDLAEAAMEVQKL